MRVIVLEFLDSDVFSVSAENRIAFLDPLIDSWDIDLNNFGMEIVLNRRLASEYVKKLEFVEREAGASSGEELGLKEFLGTPSMSGDVTAGEIEFLGRLRFGGGRPTALYYYRELQNLRDPLRFRGESGRGATARNSEGENRAGRKGAGAPRLREKRRQK